MEKIGFELSYFTSQNEVDQTSTAQDGWIFEDGGRYRNEALGIELRYRAEETAAGARLRIAGEDIVESKGNRIKELTILLPDAVGCENDGSSLVLPLDLGMLCKTSGKPEREYRIPVFCERDMDDSWCNMGLYGRLDRRGGCCVVLEEGKYDCVLRLRTAFGSGREYRIDPVYLVREWPDDNPQMREISLCVVKTASCGLAALAAAIRRYNRIERKLPTLLEKCKDNPALAYSMKALTVRLRMAVKELPCVVYEQTPETEPEPKALMTYRDVENIVAAYRKNGIGPAEFNLVGWNHGGHDGAFPQLFPVCTAPGSEEELRHAARFINECGYKINLHDNYYDAYTLASNLDFGDVCTDDTPPYHMPVPAGGLLGGGRAYRLCGKRALEYQRENLALVKERLPELSGPYYIDVTALIKLHRCADPRHPESRTDNAESYKALLRNLQKQYGVSMSEGARDWSLPEIDRAYLLANRMDRDKAFEFADESVPLCQLIYHGFVIYNTLRTGVNTWAGSFDYLYNFSTGGLPLIYYHHIFNPAWGEFNGWKNDLDATPEAIEADMPRIKRMSDDIARVSHLTGICISDIIRHNGDLTETRFENGSSIFVNYGETPAKIGGITVPPRDFTVVDA